MLVCENCSNVTTPLYNVTGIWYYHCSSCGLTQLDTPMDEALASTLYDDSYFSGGGAGYPDYVAESQLLREHGRRYAHIVSAFMNPGRLLDVGGAAGYIAQGFCDDGWTATVIEPNRRMVSIAASLGEEARVGTLETFQTPEPFDLVAMIQVIAHFFDLRKALDAAANVTADGRYWLVETWNGESAIARLLKSQWHEFSPPSVRRIFTPATLDKTVAQYGFTRVAFGRPQKWLSAAHAKSLLAYKATHDGIVTRIANAVAQLAPDKLRIPYPAEDLFWALYRKGGVRSR